MNKRSCVGNLIFFYFDDNEKLELFRIPKKSKFQGILPTNMLASLDIHNIFVSDVYMEDIADTKCQLHTIHLEQYYIQQKNDQNFRHLC